LIDALYCGWAISINGTPNRQVRNASALLAATRKKEIARARDVLYLGRGSSYPLALEGALKLKELSYIHARATPPAR
jgi:glucosamine 6-phosphate synthetase-like amidotransferase/phosphosugar isomerase protein